MSLLFLALLFLTWSTGWRELFSLTIFLLFALLLFSKRDPVLPRLSAWLLSSGLGMALGLAKVWVFCLPLGWGSAGRNTRVPWAGGLEPGCCVWFCGLVFCLSHQVPRGSYNYSSCFLCSLFCFPSSLSVSLGGSFLNAVFLEAPRYLLGVHRLFVA